MTEADLDLTRWARERERWLYVLDTYWSLPEELLRAKLASATLDELVKMADAERDGQLAT